MLDRAASVRFLGELTRLDDSAGADRLAAVLGDLPLGLQQAAAYVSQHEGMTFDDYRQLLAEEFERAAGDPGEGQSGERTIAAVWTVAMSAVERRNRLAVEVLDVLAWLAAGELPEVVLSRLADNPRDVGDALAVLSSYSMVSRRSGGVTVHRLVQAVTRSAAAAGGRAESAWVTAIRLLVAAAPRDPANDLGGWPLWAVLLPHVMALAEHLPSGHDSMVSHPKDRAATYQQGPGHVSAASTAAERALADRERRLGPEHPDTLTARANLAIAYSEAGGTKDAIMILERLLVDRERVIGPDDPSTLTVRANLAACYWLAGRAGDAVALFGRVLAGSERLLDAENPDAGAAATILQAWRAASRP